MKKTLKTFKTTTKNTIETNTKMAQMAMIAAGAMWAHGALAQDGAAPAPAEEPAPATEPAAAPAEAAAPAAAEATEATEAPPAAAPAAGPSISTMFFVDAFANLQSAQAGTGGPWHRAYDSVSPGVGSTSGFGLSFAGGDISLGADGFGFTTSLRLGPSVPLYYAGDTSPFGIENITQAYVTISSIPGLAIDVGQFGTIYGAEVAESWRNKNYTRGGLYYGMQPFWHTGARAGWSITDRIKLTGMVVNGTNNVALGANNVNVGLQAAYVAEMFSIVLGTLQAVDGAANASSFDRFFDIVATLSLGDFSAVLNLDWNIDETENFSFSGSSFGGVSLAGAYQFGSAFGLAARAEYLQDANNALYAVDADKGYTGNVDVFTGTITVDVRPLGNSNLIVRWDNRMEWSNKNIYFNAGGAGAGLWFTSVLGLVVNTEGL